ncbi:hypothetical protein HDU78_005413 [Chytriomyces hyalinus]|nr:hypothetical protein HDU78_005413 [Chytriomyces hyalinus]
MYVYSDAEDTSGSGISVLNFLIIGALCGFIIAISVIGLLATAVKLLQDKSGKFWILGTFMSVFNVTCVVFMCLFIWCVELSESNCYGGYFVQNFFFHAFCVSFDSFILYRAYGTCGWNQCVLLGSIVLVLHRIGWWAADLKESYGYWDSGIRTCGYYQNPNTAVGSNCADILADVFSTAIILRSIFIVGVNSFQFYVSLNVTDYYSLLLAWTVQDLAYTASVNAEIFWIDVRKASASKQLTEFLPSLNDESDQLGSGKDASYYNSNGRVFNSVGIK